MYYEVLLYVTTTQTMTINTSYNLHLFNQTMVSLGYISGSCQYSFKSATDN